MPLFHDFDAAHGRPRERCHDAAADDTNISFGALPDGDVTEISQWVTRMGFTRWRIYRYSRFYRERKMVTRSPGGAARRVDTCAGMTRLRRQD